jgi:FAD dependent oxidoreductase TIGR03364
MKNKVIIVGSGIMGLSVARAFAEKGWQVSVYERSSRPLGASIRNFGMIWPIGQTDGIFYDRAIRTREIWKQLCKESKSWYNQSGSVHVAQNELESQVMQEVATIYSDLRPVGWLSASDLVKKYPSIQPSNTFGGLWSEDEMIIESRQIMQVLPSFFSEKYAIEFHFEQLVTEVQTGYIKLGSTRVEADLICICNGAEFELLYPAVFKEYFTKCQLQMLRIISQPNNYLLGPSICGGLSLIHYKSFAVASSLPALKLFYESNYAEYLKYGIHVMVSQNHMGELTIGDSHEYGSDFPPFDSAYINRLVLDYLEKIVLLKDWHIIQTWNGIYSKLLNGSTGFNKEIEENVWIVNGVGGAGMTLSLAYAEDFISDLNI